MKVDGPPMGSSDFMTKLVALKMVELKSANEGLVSKLAAAALFSRSMVSNLLISSLFTHTVS